MPNSIASRQSRETISSLSAGLGGFGDDVELNELENTMADFGDLFLKNMAKLMNERQAVASGTILRDAKFEISEGGTLMQFFVPDYYDYPNEGVKGWGSSKNAPGSPYQYKTKGMSAEGRASIKQYIQSGRAKIDTVVKTKDKALGIGSERKKLSLLDANTNTMVYLIKKYGIKRTQYFTDALKMTFEGTDFELKMSEAVGRDIVFTLEKLNR